MKNLRADLSKIAQEASDAELVAMLFQSSKVSRANAALEAGNRLSIKAAPLLSNALIEGARDVSNASPGLFGFTVRELCLVALLRSQTETVREQGFQLLADSDSTVCDNVLWELQRFGVETISLKDRLHLAA